MKIYLKLALAILVITCAAVGLVSFMNYVKYQNTYTNLLASRFAVIGQAVKQTIENGLVLGFRLDQLGNVRGTIERFQQDDPLIQALHIVDNNDTVLFSTEPSWEAQQLPTGLNMSFEESDLWQGELQDSLLAGVPILDNTGEISGSVLIAYSRELVTESLQATQQQLVRISIGVLVVSLLISLGCVLVSFRSMVASIRRIRDWLMGITQGTNPQNFQPTDRSDLEQHFARFWDRASNTLERLQDLEAGRKPDFSQEYQRMRAQLASMNPAATPLTPPRLGR